MASESRLALLEARKLSKSFGGVKVLEDVSFDVRSGDCIVLKGANGSGKTTLLNILSGLLTPDSGTIQLHRDGRRSEVFEFGSRNGRFGGEGGFSLGALARHGVLRSWQDVRLFSSLTPLDNLNVAAADQIGEGMAAALFRPRGVRDRELSVSEASAAMLNSFGVCQPPGAAGALSLRARAGKSAATDGRRPTGDTVSLGEAKRIALARACRGESRFLLLDEPLSGLDGAGIRAVVELLRHLNRDLRLALLLVEHESTVEHLEELASAVWRLDRGNLVSDSAVCARDGDTSFVERWKREATRDGESNRTVPLPGGSSLSVIARAGDRLPPDGLELRDVRVARGGRSVLPSLSFAIPRGGLGILEAPNGWGKTTLVLALAGRLPLQSGEVVVNGVSMGKQATWRRRRLGVTLLQSRGASFPKLTVREALDIAACKAVPAYLSRLAGRTIASLSGGERQRLLFACSQGSEPARLTLWDEPFLDLDEEGVSLLTDTVRTRGPDQTFLVVVPATVSDMDREQMEAS